MGEKDMHTAYPSWSQGYKVFHAQPQLSIEFHLLIESKMQKNKDCSCFHSQMLYLSCSLQENLKYLRMKFQLLIKTKMSKITGDSGFQTLRWCIYHAKNVKMPMMTF